MTTDHFSVTKRNFGHWDFLGSDGRLFRIRGTPGEWKAMDERERPFPVTTFKSFTLCVAFVFEELMHEELIQDLESKCNNVPGRTP